MAAVRELDDSRIVGRGRRVGPGLVPDRRPRGHARDDAAIDPPVPEEPQEKARARGRQELAPPEAVEELGHREWSSRVHGVRGELFDRGMTRRFQRRLHQRRHTSHGPLLFGEGVLDPVKLEDRLPLRAVDPDPIEAQGPKGVGDRRRAPGQPQERVAGGVVAVGNQRFEQTSHRVCAATSGPVGRQRRATDPEVPGREPHCVDEAHHAGVHLAQERDRDRELIDARQEERLVAPRRHPAARLEVDRRHSDVPVESRRQGHDPGVERGQRGVGRRDADPCRRGVDVCRRPDLEGGDEQPEGGQDGLLEGEGRIGEPQDTPPRATGEPGRRRVYIDAAWPNAPPPCRHARGS